MKHLKTYENLHNLTAKDKICDMVQFEPFRETFEDLIAPELLEITNYEKLLVLVRQAYLMKLPFEKVWSSLVNVLLLLHQELPAETLIEMSWYVCKSLKDKDLKRFLLRLKKESAKSCSLKAGQAKLR